MAEFAKTINQLVDQLLTRCRSGTGTTDPMYPQALLDLNLALQELAISYNWKWMGKEVTLSVPAGTRLVNAVGSFPTDVINYKDIIASYNGRNIPLDLISLKEADELYPDITLTGTPAHYVLGPPLVSTTVPPKRTIELRPAPNVDITLFVSYDYTFKSYTSAEGAEVPPIPQYYYSCLIELAASRFLRANKNPDAEINDALRLYGYLVTKLAKKDADLNKVTKAIRLPQVVSSYRSRRYK